MDCLFGSVEATVSVCVRSELMAVVGVLVIPIVVCVDVVVVLAVVVVDN